VVVETGGLFRDDKGKTLRLYAMDYGNASNNEAELHALKRVLYLFPIGSPWLEKLCQETKSASL